MKTLDTTAEASAFIQVNNLWQEYDGQVVLERLNLSVKEG